MIALALKLRLNIDSHIYIYSKKLSYRWQRVACVSVV